MKNRIATLIILVIAMTAIIVGCSRSKTIKTDEGEITVDEKGESLTMKFKGDEGQDINIKIGKDELPKNLPDDIPIYKPSKVATSQIMGEKNMMLNLTTDDDASTVTKFYEQKLKEKGWTIGQVMNFGPAMIMNSTKGNKELNVTINRDKKTTSIALVFAEE